MGMSSPLVYDRNEIFTQRWVRLSLYLEGKNVVSSSLPFGSQLTLRLRCDRRLCAETPKLLLLYDKTGEWSEYSPVCEKFTFSDRIFEFTLSPSLLCQKDGFGLFFYRFSLKTPWGEFYTQRIPSFTEDEPLCRTTESGRMYEMPLGLSENKDSWDEILHPLTVYASNRGLSSSLEGAVIYHVFVDRFARGNKVYRRADAAYNDDWHHGVPEYALNPGEAFPNNTHFGGSIDGVIEKLEYIRSLGVDYIYLSPIFKAFSNHKYDTGNYMEVDELFGGEKALRRLIRSAEKLGMRVILDGVFNHTGDDSLYFNKRGTYPGVGAYQSKDSPYYSWYSFKEHPLSYESWWGVQCLPTIRKDCKEFWEYIAGDGGVVEKYAKMGVAGFRLDVVDELSRPFLCAIRDKLSESNSENCLIGEVWEDASTKVAYGERRSYFSSLDLDGVISYPFRRSILSFCRGESASAVGNELSFIFENYPHHALLSSMNVLSTHDTERIVTLLGNPDCSRLSNDELSVFRLTSEQREQAICLQKLAAVMQFTLPGAPTVYYGDETALEGGRDPFNRRCYPWGEEDGELIDYYRFLSRLHSQNRALKKGSAKVLYAANNVLIYQRCLGDQQMVVMLNSSPAFKNNPLKSLRGRDLLTGNHLETVDTIPPRCALVIELVK